MVSHIFDNKTLLPSRYNPKLCDRNVVWFLFCLIMKKRSLKQELLGHDKRSNL